MLPTKARHFEILFRRSGIFPIKSSNKILRSSINLLDQVRGKNDSSDTNISSLFQPVSVKSNPDDINVGAELTTALKKADLVRIINAFTLKKEVKALALENGLNKFLWQKAVNSFRKYCVEAESLPVDLHIVISDILQGAGNVTDIFPYFMRHAKEIFPHIDCLDDLKKISDLRTPANWYPVARSITRKIIFHAGPTNSGKTYHALERFMNAKSGVYCGPLKLLATEVFNKCNAYFCGHETLLQSIGKVKKPGVRKKNEVFSDLFKQGTPCDLVTGEERRFAKDENNPSPHIACTVEMMALNNPCDVAVIDEIQLIQDAGRGWAWTRALLGIPANEVHVCGEAAAIELIESLCVQTGETVEVRKYKRLTELEIEDDAICTLNNVKPGDCIVCFNKADIYTLSQNLEQQNIETAVIYGSLPPGTKIAQATKFNDPKHPCKVLVSTDAIGMGLNLHIRRIIFYSLIKPTINKKGEKEMDIISVSTALQIAGRAGRYGTQWDKGFVTTFKPKDLPTLKSLLSQTPETITQAGLQPTADQIELYAYHLPKAPLSNLMDIFVSLCTVDDSLYFMCNIDDFKFLADMIEHVPLQLRVRYVFCCAPINKKLPFVCTMFLKFARQFSKSEPITFNWLCQHIGWPLRSPKTLSDLVNLEAIFDVLDVYLWLSYRFMDMFPDANLVQDLEKEIDAVIQDSIYKLAKLLKNSESGIVSAGVAASEEDNFELNSQKNNYLHAPTENAVPQTPFKGKLTERLLSQGLLTPSMLQELQREWTQKVHKQDDSERTTRRKFSRKPKIV